MYLDIIFTRLGLRRYEQKLERQLIACLLVCFSSVGVLSPFGLACVRIDGGRTKQKETTPNTQTNKGTPILSEGVADMSLLTSTVCVCVPNTAYVKKKT